MATFKIDDECRFTISATLIVDEASHTFQAQGITKVVLRRPPLAIVQAGFTYFELGCC